MENKDVILKLCAEAHSLTEQCYTAHPAAKGDAEWLDKRKFLLADLSLHMVQAALQKDHADTDLIKRSLFSILTICKDFIPEIELESTANRLMEQ